MLGPPRPSRKSTALSIPKSSGPKDATIGVALSTLGEKELGAMFFEAAGWERPHWYRSNRRLLEEFDVPERTGWEGMWWSPIIGAEHQAVRNRVGMFDLTAFQKLDVVGPGALDYIEYMTVYRMDRPIGRAVYTPLVNSFGGIVSDLTIQRLGEDHFRVITGGGVGMHDLAWFRKHLPEDGSVHIQDITSSLAVVGVWGPRARDMLQSVCDTDLSNEAFPFSTVQEIILGAIPASALRISYVGRVGLGDLHPNGVRTEAVGLVMGGWTGLWRHPGWTQWIRIVASVGEGVPILGPRHKFRVQPLRGRPDAR